MGHRIGSISPMLGLVLVSVMLPTVGCRDQGKPAGASSSAEPTPPVESPSSAPSPSAAAGSSAADSAAADSPEVESAEADSPCDLGALREVSKQLAAREAAWTPASGLMPDFSLDAVSAVWLHCPTLPDEAKRLLHALIDHRAMPSLADIAAAEGRPAPAVNDDPLDAKLPGHAAFHGFDDAATKAAWAWRATLCPDYSARAMEAGKVAAADRPAKYWDGCLDRFGLMTKDEYLATRGSGNVGFALYRWLTDHGVDGAVAKPLARSVELGRHWLVEGWDFDLRLPVAAVPTRLEDGPIVSLDRRKVHFNSRIVAQIDPVDGLSHELVTSRGESIVPMLFEGLAEEYEHGRTLAEGRGEPWEGVVPILAHRELPWSQLRPIVASAHQAGYQRVLVIGLADDRVDPLRQVVVHDAKAPGGPLELPETTTVQGVIDAVVARGGAVRLLP